MAAAIATCSTADQVRFLAQRSCSKKISALLAMALERLGHNADVCDPGTLHRVHDRGKSSEGHVLIRAHEDELARRIAHLLVQPLSDFVDVNRIVAHEDTLLL